MGEDGTSSGYCIAVDIVILPVRRKRRKPESGCNVVAGEGVLL
jgi:hypothetical protein